ncbi:MAG TPA: UDP-glucose/GDP-mannose dehydrogenase family protein [Oligoflexia bacterium]|nr:UDP-glucose/GDP-mannose dehydrogenase family protein [Oligoflexia bacterium]HMP47101.1 UDP-glucose/GDP-mannose dehydrogenase family protein [Oligoflexia bacterium]
MNVGVIGSGYVGLVAGTCFAESGNDVICADVNEEKIAMLNKGQVPIYEPGLDQMIAVNAEAGRLSFTTDIDSCIQCSEVIFIAVGTPQDTDGSADLKYVLQVAARIGKVMNGPKIIVNKSTVPVGTADLVAEEISKHTNFPFDVVSNPEFLKEGSAIEDFMKPDRVVIGTSSVEAAEVMRELYSPFVRTNNPILVMDVKSAEVTKYAANALLATRITFMNEVANLCEKVGADVSQVRKGVGTDSRIGSSFLFPGVGYGGSCFPKDVRALIKTGQINGTPMQVIEAVDVANNRQKKKMPEQVISHYGGPEMLKGKRFAMWGLAFKPKTDDMREAPSMTIVKELALHGASIKAYDPEAMEVAAKICKTGDLPVEFSKSAYEALDGADALLIVTEWNEFRRPNFGKMTQMLNAPVIFDGRNLFEPQKMARLGFTYYSIGRPVSMSSGAINTGSNGSGF